VLPGESGSMLASDLWLQARRDVVSRLVASRFEG
jgi:hypothetical protein